MAVPPTGNVTFLFTDIEGSTMLWERHPAQMRDALRRHDGLLRKTIRSRGGHVFKTMGDAFCAAFASSNQAVLAALESQRALFAEDWDDNVVVRVRMALHTGETEERDGDYFGPPVNRVARILGTTLGGQVLLSSATQMLVRDQLAHAEPEAELHDLGERSLKDLSRPEHVFQLIAPGMPRVEGRRNEGREPTERYHIKEPLGSGGMAQVYLAYDEELDREVAYKRLRPQYADDEEVVERFRREATSAASLSHQHIVPIYDRGRTKEGSFYIIMEYVSEGTLKDRIAREGPIPASEAAALALQVAKALRAAHKRGIIHRDIKPQNVLLTEDGEAKVADFGIARAASSKTMTGTGQILGTVHYVSPEQALGQPVSERSDLYSLGVVLYEMLTGELPYDADTPVGIVMSHVGGQLRPPKEINPEVPEELNEVAVRLLARDPDDRYPDAAATVEDLERVVAGDRATPEPERVPAGVARGGTSRRPSKQPDMPPPPPPELPADGDRRGAGERRRGFPMVAAVVAAVVVLAALGVAAVFLSGSNTVDVPALEGKTLAAAREQAGDDFELVSRQEDSSEPKGRILGQDPRPGTEVDQGERVTVTVSTGMVKVPDVAGKSEEEAGKALRSAGFEWSKQARESSAEDEGKVLDQTPAAGDEAEAGSEVKITVGEGPPPDYSY